jgi:hypothetical protein
LGKSATPIFQHRLKTVYSTESPFLTLLRHIAEKPSVLGASKKRKQKQKPVLTPFRLAMSFRGLLFGGNFILPARVCAPFPVENHGGQRISRVGSAKLTPNH